MGLGLIRQQKERQLWDQRFVQPLPKYHYPHPNKPDLEQPLRISYVSVDFKCHSAAQGFADLILNYDAKQFQVYCYSGVGIQQADKLTVSFQDQASVWRSIRGITDTALAEQIRNDQIDILVDPSGHTAGNRLVTFGYKPAPIQVTGIGSCVIA
jgi:predicted O-linked N-acetylglucosamine transferase (SPINDLY family)